MTLAEPLKITRIITSIFDELRIPYYVVGSLASSFHGIPRATADADLVAEIQPGQILLLSEKLRNKFYVDEERIQKAVRNHSSFNVIHLETMFKIDVFIQKENPFSEKVMDRRILYQVTEEKGQELYLATAEDIILSKLEWYKAWGMVSEHQWTDVLGVMQVRSDNLDFMYLKESAEKRNLADLLNEAFKAAGIYRKA